MLLTLTIKELRPKTKKNKEIVPLSAQIGLFFVRFYLFVFEICNADFAFTFSEIHRVKVEKDK